MFIDIYCIHPKICNLIHFDLCLYSLYKTLILNLRIFCYGARFVRLDKAKYIEMQRKTTSIFNTISIVLFQLLQFTLFFHAPAFFGLTIRIMARRLNESSDNDRVYSDIFFNSQSHLLPYTLNLLMRCRESIVVLQYVLGTAIFS